MKLTLRAISLLSCVMLAVSIISCTSGASSKNKASGITHKRYVITSTQAWIDHCASATDVSVIEDGFMSMDKELIVSIAIELSKDVRSYAWVDASLLCFVSDDVKQKALAQTYITYGIAYHKQLFSSYQLGMIDDGGLGAFSILGASKVLGKDNYASIVAEYEQYITK